MHRTCHDTSCAWGITTFQDQSLRFDGVLWSIVGSLWSIVGSLWSIVGSLWSIVERFASRLARCGRGRQLVIHLLHPMIFACYASPALDRNEISGGYTVRHVCFSHL